MNTRRKRAGMTPRQAGKVVAGTSPGTEESLSRGKRDAA